MPVKVNVTPLRVETAQTASVVSLNVNALVDPVRITRSVVLLTSTVLKPALIVAAKPLAVVPVAEPMEVVPSRICRDGDSALVNVGTVSTAA